MARMQDSACSVYCGTSVLQYELTFPELVHTMYMLFILGVTAHKYRISPSTSAVLHVIYCD
jgi:hypothetical protein